MQEVAPNSCLCLEVQFEKRAPIVLLNGVGSVGKSSIAKALQNIPGYFWLSVKRAKISCLAARITSFSMGSSTTWLLVSRMFR